MIARFLVSATLIVTLATAARADRIDFSALVGTDAADANGQIPEPAAWLFAMCGPALGILVARRRKRVAIEAQR